MAKVSWDPAVLGGDWSRTVYRIGDLGCYKFGCDHRIVADSSTSFWEVFHYFPGEKDHGEAYRKFEFVDYVPTAGCASPLYYAVRKWFDEIHEYMLKAQENYV